MNTVHHFLCLSFIFLLLAGCAKKEYKNQPEYTLKVGESVELYFSTNSCCYYCVLNRSDLSKVEFVEEKTVEPYPDDCAGCSYTGAFVFKAVEAGTDTVKLKMSVASEDCESYEGEPQVFVIKVQ